MLIIFAAPLESRADLFQIESGVFRTIGGFAGILDFELPRERQSFVRFEETPNNRATMQFLDENQEPVDLFGVGVDFGEGVFDANQNEFVFFDDSLDAPFETIGTINYHAVLRDINTLSIEGTFASSPPVCCDIIQGYEHIAVVATRTEKQIDGDFDRDSFLDLDDVDLLTAEIQSENPDLDFDLNNDASVDTVDLHFWIREIKSTWIGDSNLDGVFNSGDLVSIFGAGEYEDDVPGNSTWGEGDWNGNGDFTSTDLIEAFSDGGFELGPREEVATVPEPVGTGVGLVFAILVCGRATRRAASLI